MAPLNASLDRATGIFKVNEIKIFPKMNIGDFRNAISCEKDYDSHKDWYTFTLKERLNFESMKLRVMVDFVSVILDRITIIQEYEEEKTSPLLLDKYEALAQMLLESDKKKFGWGAIEISQFEDGFSKLVINYRYPWLQTKEIA
jgi:hypothetical protein